MRNIIKLPVTFLMLLAGMLIVSQTGCDKNANALKVGVFEVNVTPSIGGKVAYATVNSIVDSLYAKGVVILSV